MDPDEVIILASPQHPIKAQWIKYYEDPLFKAMVEKQEGREFPYPPNVEGVSPWIETDVDEAENKPKPEAPIEDRNEFRRARAMHVDVERGGGVTQARYDPDDPVPREWDVVLAKQSDFLDALMEEHGLAD